MTHPKDPAKAQSSAKARSVFSEADFPSLRRFLRGYFHQDMKDEHGSAEGAVRQFCQDADEDERSVVAKEWSEFVHKTKSQSQEHINQILTDQLGSSYSLSSEDLATITAILREPRVRD